MKSKQDLVNDAFNYAINFYSSNDRHLDNQFKCLHEMMRITGLDDITCVKIQDPILTVLRAQDTMNIGNEAIHSLHRVVSNNLRSHMVELGVQNFQHIPTSEMKDIVDRCSPEQSAITSRYQSIMKGFTGQVLGGAIHDERHKKDYSEKPQVNKELLNAVRKVDRENNAGAVNFMLFHDHYLNDDDMYWMSSIFNTHKDKLAVNMLDLSSNCFHLAANKDMPFFSFNYPFHTPWNILRLDLSNNNIGDDGTKCIADGLAKGFFPITKQINLSGNKITDTGKGFIANAMHKINQGLVITIETIQNASKETFKIGVKAMLSIAKNNGISTKEALTTEETIEHCKKGIPNVGKNIGIGIAKCSNSLIKYTKPNEVTLQDIGIDILGFIVPQIKPVTNSICYTEKIAFSIVDEEFANCLSGLDSNLNN